MSRYTGPKCRLCRRVGEKLLLKGAKCLGPRCTIERRPSPPGVHTRRRRKLSDRGVQLQEKQKARYSYGIQERQFRKMFVEAERLPGVTGETFLMSLEKRLDNVAFRLGFADSRAQSRQVVCHGHLLINGVKTDIPSYSVKPGDVISWREPSKKTAYYEERISLLKGSHQVPRWLSLDPETLSGRVLSNPASDDIESKFFDEQAIVAYYSR